MDLIHLGVYMEHLLSISQIFSILKHSETVEGEYGAQTKEPKLTHNAQYITKYFCL